MKPLHHAITAATAIAITLSGIHAASATETNTAPSADTQAPKPVNTVTSDVDCSVSAAWGLYKFNQKSNFSAEFEMPESVKAGTGFDALIKIKDISVSNDNLSGYKNAKLTKSSIRINVGKNVKLDGNQPGLSLSNGVLSINDHLKASLEGNSLRISAAPITVRLQALTEGTLTFIPEKTILTNTASVDGYTANTTCTTNADKPFATVKVDPADGLTITAPESASIKQDVQITATVPEKLNEKMDGKVQFFVNHIAAGDPVPVTEDNKASTSIIFDTSGSKTITARFIDAEGYNPAPDGETIIPVVTELDTKKPEDTDSYTGLINGSATSLLKPAKVMPGEKVSVSASLLPNKAPIRVYEIGINAPEDVKYIDGTGKTNYSSKLATTGSVFSSPGSGYYDPEWKNESKKPNESYRGFHSDTSYSVVDTSPQTVSAEFEIPKTLAPGIYMFQMGVYKYSNSLKDLVSIPETAFEIAGPDLPALPERKIKPQPEETPEVSDGSSTAKLVKSPWFWTGIIGAVAGIAALVYKFFFALR
ncbi:Ig-like domain-containing protein [Corynebacterium diphtheriae]|uniref:Ig-like domain-containing protein n=1 Tax=Corynebacterium diphtheriae TaxID=1717 RepID=UPI0013C6C6E8|nr:Ig-like domain repeat protein [Corynebacterium diphtheriae]CAB0887833.1 Ig-like domain repeat protein [Corynebacterium diphtheriae]